MSTANSGWRQLSSGIAVGLVSVATVMAGILLSSQAPGAPVPTSVALATPSATPAPLSTLPPTAPPTPTQTPTGTTHPTLPGVTTTPGPTVTPLPPTTCPIPGGWSIYTVRTGDSLESLASWFGTSVYAIIENNCLADTDLRPGLMLYLPPSPTRGPTPTRVPCGPPSTWVYYTVQPGDTLYGLAVRHGTTVSALAQANCMSGYTLYVGKSIFVPPVVVITPTRIPLITPTRVPLHTPTPTASLTPPSATLPATSTHIAPSHTPTPPLPVTPTTPPPTTEPSATPSTVAPSATHTPLPPTLTPTATIGIVPSPTVGPSATTLPSATPRPTNTATTAPSPTSPSPTP